MKHFLLAGTYQDSDRVYLTASHRQAAKGGTVFHRNDYSTLLDIPNEFYKEHFAFNRSTFIYETTLRWKDVRQYCEVITY